MYSGTCRDSVATPCVNLNSMHMRRASLRAGGYDILIGLASHKAHTASTDQLSTFSQDPHILPPTSFQVHRPRSRHRQPTMLSLHCNAPILFATTLTLTLPLLATSIPTTANTNQTTTTTTTEPPALAHLPTSILPDALMADTCPTPPTEFLPYAPPPGYTPAPGCPPANAGTQPSEGNPPARSYEGSESRSSGGTASAEVSAAGRSRAMGAVGRALLVVLGWRGLKWCVVLGAR